MPSQLLKKEIVTAIYANEKHNLIHVYLRGKGTSIYSYYVPVQDPNNEDLKALLELGYSFEKIYEETIKWNKSFSDGFQQLCALHAKNDIENLKISHAEELDKIRKNAFANGKLIFQSLVENNNNKTAVREAKIAAFELESVLKQDKAVKAKIRNCKTITDLISIIENGNKS